MNVWRVAIAVLLTVAAGVFVVGVSIERSGEDDHPAETSESTSSEEGEEPRDEEREEEAARGDEEEGEGAEDGENEELFGVDTESNALVAVFVVVSLLLAAATIVVRGPITLIAVVVFATAAFAFDVREIVQKMDESETTIAALAAVVAALHVLVALVAASCLLRERRNAGTPTPT